MLSYQHAFHAGNLADVHKHAILADVLAYLTLKDKPISYIETHAGRALYDLSGDEAQKTQEAAGGVERLEDALPSDHPYRQTLARIRKEHGAHAYPGSPLIAKALLRPTDTVHLSELHPQEYAALRNTIRGANIYKRDGFETAISLCPPMPRRGLLLCDPSWEIKDDYSYLPKFFGQIAQKWNVGILALWYPILTSAAHKPMIKALEQKFPDALKSEVRFPPVREGHRMIGSGMFLVNPPYGLADKVKKIEAIFARL